MRNRPLWIYVMMLIALTGMSLFLVQGTAQAFTPVNPVICSSGMANNTNDNDLDGFTDYQECLSNGVNTPIDITNKNKIYGQLKCPGTGSNAACGPGITCHCLDPNKQDLFVIIVKASSGSLFPTNQNLLSYVSAPISQGGGGLGIAVHPIYPTMTPLSRTVISGSNQKAVQVTESLDTTSTDVLGFSNTGTPNGQDGTTIYTARIKAFIQTACGGTGTYPNITGSTYNTSKCGDSTGLFGDALLQKYILHTIAHEIGHVLGPLAPTYDSNYGGYHYMPGTNVIMDQSIYYTYDSKSKQTTFYIGKDYTALDQSSTKLWP